MVPGDRIAGFVPNSEHAVIAMLASVWLGAVWTSCSPDFGLQGVLDRFGQVHPKVLFATDGYSYAGKAIDTRARVAELLAELGLAGYGERYPDQISGGEARRVALARALAARPGLVLMDEPLTNLDAERRALLLDLIARNPGTANRLAERNTA